MSKTVDIAHGGMLYVRYTKENRFSFLKTLEELGYTLRDYLWDEEDYIFPIITVDPRSKTAFGAGVTIMACLCSSGGRDITQEQALPIIQSLAAQTIE